MSSSSFSSPSSASSAGPVRVSWVLLTMGDRPAELAAAVASIPAAAGVEHEVVVVVNGRADAVVPDGVVRVDLEQNVGIPAGRNRGAQHATGDLLVFLDDDAVVQDPGLVARTVARFAAEPDLAAVGFRIVDPDGGGTAARHVPRLGRGDPERSGDVTSFPGGACAVRAAAFHAVGGLPDPFFYALEETDLAWRLIDAGWRIAYDGDAVVHHPRTEIERHGSATRLTARNRVLLARRRLPWILGVLYVADWFAITWLRTRRIGELWQGTREGLEGPVDRQPMRWRTVWTLTRLGRPPVV